MRLEQFGFKKKCLMNNDSNSNESSESERAPSSQDADISSCDKPQSSTSEPKDLSTVMTDENIDKSPTSSGSDLDADQDSDSEYQSQTVINSLAPVDGRLINSEKYEVFYPWLYFSGNKNGYLCKYCELFLTLVIKLIQYASVDSSFNCPC